MKTLSKEEIIMIINERINDKVERIEKIRTKMKKHIDDCSSEQIQIYLLESSRYESGIYELQELLEDISYFMDED